MIRKLEAITAQVPSRLRNFAGNHQFPSLLPAMSIHSVDDLRALYHRLEREVSEAVNIPLRAAAVPGGVAGVQRRVLDFLHLSAQVCNPDLEPLALTCETSTTGSLPTATSANAYGRAWRTC